MGDVLLKKPSCSQQKPFIALPLSIDALLIPLTKTLTNLHPIVTGIHLIFKRLGGLGIIAKIGVDGAACCVVNIKASMVTLKTRPCSQIAKPKAEANGGIDIGRCGNPLIN